MNKRHFFLLTIFTALGLLSCEPKVDSFFLGRPHRQSTWQKRRSTRCPAGALEGKWRRGARS